MSVLLWVQTVCKDYQQTTKVTASKEKVMAGHDLVDVSIFVDKVSGCARVFHELKCIYPLDSTDYRNRAEIRGYCRRPADDWSHDLLHWGCHDLISWVFEIFFTQLKHVTSLSNLKTR